MHCLLICQRLQSPHRFCVFMQVAVKVLTKKRGSQARGKVLRKIAREIDLLTKLQECCNVIQLLTVYEDEEHAYLVCELCKGGDLEKILLVSF